MSRFREYPQVQRPVDAPRYWIGPYRRCPAYQVLTPGGIWVSTMGARYYTKPHLKLKGSNSK